MYAVGAENQTFGIKGVKEHACFLKEVWDAEKIRGRIMDCIETANFAGQTQAEIDRLLHFVSAFSPFALDTLKPVSDANAILRLSSEVDLPVSSTPVNFTISSRRISET